MKVTCITPTANRPHLLVKCVDCFLKQDYKDKELIILDDGKEAFKYAKDLPSEVKYIYRGPKRKSIGAKLNALIDESLTDVICRFDDDDWYASNRVSQQVKVLESGAVFTGYHTILFWDERYDKVYKYFQTTHYASGTSFMFHTSVWCEEKFDHLCITGSDNNFLDKHQLKLEALDGSKIVVARLHKQGSNIEVKTPEYFKSMWQYTEMANSDIPPAFWASQLATKLDAA